jgi:DNA-binding response OmpR family regulator
LWILVNNAGRVVRTDQLIERVWRDELVLEDVLRVNVSRLRRKLKSEHQETNYIQNERGLGYRFITLQKQ